MKRVDLMLTEKQTLLLSDMFAMVSRDAEADKPGMVIGQFCEATEGEGFFSVGYLDNEASVKLQAVMGIDTGSKTPGGLVVLSDVE